LTQVSLRKWVAPLCKFYLSAGHEQGSLFSTAGILASGEKPPVADDIRLVWAAARNGWLDLFDETSVEVQQLLTLYRSVKSKNGQSEADARQAVCMAVLLAPQFLLGNVTPSDPIRRVSLELGRVLPRFQDLADYRDGKLSIEAYTEKLQTDPYYKAGYRAALRNWHRDWWGLREFRSVPRGTAILEVDPRSFGALTKTWSEIGSTYMAPRMIYSDGRALVVPRGGLNTDELSYSGFGCNPYGSNGSTPNLQPFDPRTVMVVAEHYYAGPNRWEVVGGWVHEARLNDYVNLVKSYDATFNGATSCQKMTTSDRRHRPNAPLYYRCEGSVTRAGGGAFLRSSMKDFHLGTISQPVVDPNDPEIVYGPKHLLNATQEHTSVLEKSVHRLFKQKNRRIRRYAPSGWQDGVSEIKTWWSGDTVYACNGFDRYRFTCPVRLSHGTDNGVEAHNWREWINAGEGGNTPDAEFFQIGLRHFTFFGVAPMLLNQYRCGKPNPSVLPLNLKLHAELNAEALNDLESRSFPRGYDFDFNDVNYLDRTFPDPAAINDVAFLGEVVGKVAPAETAAIARLQEDLFLEPYRLLDHVLDEQLPYGAVVSADYTVGREELELGYRSQFFALPNYPPNYELPAATAHQREELRLIKRGQFPPIPISWFQGPYPHESINPGFFSNSNELLRSANGKQSGYSTPSPAAGILTMPAFLSPVATTLRSVSSRVFERLLCGAPNLFVPTGAEDEEHLQYMSHPANPAPADHTKDKSSCKGCHINLDPLAAALSGTFLRWVQVNEKNALEGQFRTMGAATSEMRYYGARGKTEKGQGAFLGKKAEGFEDVGKILAESPLFYRCTTSRAFERILGRIPLLQDTAGFEKISNDFYGHRDFDRMVRDIVKSRSFQREN
jgi:hypothetical protein